MPQRSGPPFLPHAELSEIVSRTVAWIVGFNTPAGNVIREAAVVRENKTADSIGAHRML